MASVVAHIVYAKKYLEKFPSKDIHPDEFILGCVFPDIRRVDKSIKRKDTHLCFSPVDLDFKGLNSFQAGWKFHLYCDMKREEILNKYDFYSLDNTGDFWNQPTKGLEDEIIYDDYNNWEKLVHYFNNPPEINTGINVSPARNATNPSQELINYLSTPRNTTVKYNGNIMAGGWGTLELWYAIIARYIEKKPDTESMRIFLSKQVGFSESIDGIAASVDKLRKSAKVIEILKKVAEEIV